MDLIKIGKFIAQLRKGKGLTQVQLADIIGVSDKTVSKWERGNGLPDVSLMLPLCGALEINVNELLTGEKLIDADYKKKAEDNMMDLIRERKENKKKRTFAIVTGLTSFLSFAVIIAITCIYSYVIPNTAKVLLIVTACAIFTIGFFTFTYSERKIGYYKCSKCGKKFTPDFFGYTLGLNIVNRRRLKCPDCGEETWCTKVLSKND